jgi:hypothetical protein
MLAFGPQRLALLRRDRLRLRPAGHRDLIPPADRVGVQHELVRGLEIVKDRHLPVTDNHELLLLERMQPGHEDVRLDATRERQEAHRHVGNALAQVAASLSLHGRRQLAE